MTHDKINHMAIDENWTPNETQHWMIPYASQNPLPIWGIPREEGASDHIEQEEEIEEEQEEICAA